LIKQYQVFTADPQLALQRVYQLGKSAHLRGGWGGSIQVANHANTDACRVNFIHPGRRGSLLVIPTLADEQFAVRGPVAIAYDKMIGEVSIRGNHRAGITSGSMALMDVNVLPATRLRHRFGAKNGIRQLITLNS